MAGGILVTGVSGQVGGELLRTLAPRGNVTAMGRAELNLSQPDSIRRAIRSVQPRWIVNPAAYTGVDRAESERDLAFAVNAAAPGILGEEAARIGAAVIHFSTDYVFAGTGDRAWREEDATGPLNVYGASKLAGEQALAASGAEHYIFRTSWVYAAAGRNFLHTVLRLAREKPEVRIVADQHGAPTSARDLARLVAATIKTLERGGQHGGPAIAQGVYHATAAGETTWFGFAEEILRLARLQRPDAGFAPLIPIATAEFPTAARRPLNSRLDCSRLASDLGFAMPAWQASLAEVMQRVRV